jgi:hypothetical protein
MHLDPQVEREKPRVTQPCYFPLLLKPAAQKENVDWNSSARSSRLRVTPVAIPVEL